MQRFERFYNFLCSPSAWNVTFHKFRWLSTRSRTFIMIIIIRIWSHVRASERPQNQLPHLIQKEGQLVIITAEEQGKELHVLTSLLLARIRILIVFSVAGLFSLLPSQTTTRRLAHNSNNSNCLSTTADQQQFYSQHTHHTQFLPSPPINYRAVCGFSISRDLNCFIEKTAIMVP